MLEHRPRSASELVDVAFGILRRDYGRFCLLMAVLVAPWLVIQLVVVRATNFDFSGQTQPEFGPLFGFILAGILWGALADACLSRAAADAWERGAFEPAEALRAGARRYFAVLGAQLIKYLAVIAYFTAAMLLAMIVGVVVALLAGGFRRPDQLLIGVATVVAALGGIAGAAFPFARYAAVPATAALEPNGPLAAARRSRDLVRGRARMAFTVMALVWAVYFALSFGVSLLAGIGGSRIVEQLASTVLMVLVYPLVVIVNVTLYYDLRMRKEGYDLELLSRQLEPVDGAPSSLPA